MLLTSMLLFLQEIVGLGLANFAGSAFNAYSTTGSFSRSAVNYDSGKSGPGQEHSSRCMNIAARAVTGIKAGSYSSVLSASVKGR